MQNHPSGGYRRTLLAVVLAVAQLATAQGKERSDSGPDISLANIWSGALITVWKTAQRSWLWGYTPYEARTWGDSVNWRIRYNKDSSMTFVNVAQGTCMTAYSAAGLTHDACTPGDASQSFLPILADSGAIQLKSVSLGRCVHAFASANYRFAFGLNLIECAESDRVADSRLLWTIHPAMVDSQVVPHDEL